MVKKINDGINWIEKWLKCGQKLPIPKGGQKFDPLGCHIRPPPHVLHQWRQVRADSVKKKRHWVKPKKLDWTSYKKQLYNQPISHIHWPGEWYVDNQSLYLLGMTALSLRLAQESDCPYSTGFTLVFVKIIHFNTTALFNSTSDQAFLSGGAWRISWRNTGSILLFGLMSIRNFLFCF